MTADAYATAFMVLGVEGSKEILNNSNLEGFLIYHAENGSLKSFVSEGIEPLLEFNKLDSNWIFYHQIAFPLSHEIEMTTT